MGAGASCGSKEAREVLDRGTEAERLIVHEGLPVVNEITKCLLAFKDVVINAPIDTGGIYEFMNTYRTDGYSVNRARDELTKDIDELYVASKEHATIDTYAKKLYLTRRQNEFERLKNVLSAFFVWIQMESKVDQRYDTFLANVLGMNLYFPKELSVISWNYDSQFEIAYKYYSQNGTLPIYEKNANGEFPQLKDSGRIFKVNGSANFGDFNLVNSIIKDGSVLPIIQLIEYYGLLKTDTSSMGFNFRSHLSFAWEHSARQNQLMEYIKKTTIDTESVIVIGYSFPFFNREIDRSIFSNMPNLKTIYIQDPFPEAVEPALKAVLPVQIDIDIKYQRDCTQFYLPREL
jgi:hypothetical protein